MTIKTVLIAVGLVLGFAGFMMVTWSISGWLVREPVAAVAPAANTEADTAKQIEKPPAQDSTQDSEQPVDTGAYDDSWSGKEALDPAPGQEPTVGKRPVANKPANVGSSDTGVFPSDDRENTAQESATENLLPSAQSGNPYGGDDRENN